MIIKISTYIAGAVGEITELHGQYTRIRNEQGSFR